MPLSPYFTSHSPSVMDAENQDHFVDRVNKKHCLKNIIATCFALKKKYKRSGNFKPYSLFFFGHYLIMRLLRIVSVQSFGYTYYNLQILKMDLILTVESWNQKVELLQ